MTFMNKAYSTIERRLFKRDRGPLVDILRSRAVYVSAPILKPKSSAKLWKRQHVVNALPKNGYGAEIGVRHGDFSKVLIEECEPQTAYFIDPWFDEKAFEIAKENLSKYPNAVIIRKKSEDAVKDIQDETLDWVYIDGSHEYEDVLYDLINWSKKVKTGGIVSGDDYYWRDANKNYSVKRAVDEFAKDGPIKSWFMSAGQFIMIKK